ncbi:hypothetical protein X975_25639, partial [Stegodyphus mimosarum]
MAVVRSWTVEIEANFIYEIQKKPHLWDVKHPYYTRKTLKKVSYDEIGESLKQRWPEYAGNFEYDLMIAKFKNMRNQYRRERKKMLTSKSNGGQGFVPKWHHFQRLGFLDDGMIAEESCSNLSISSSNFIHDEVNEEEEYVEQPSAVISQIPGVFPKVTDPSPPNYKTSTKKRKRENSDVNDLVSNSSTALKVQEVENNTEVLFGKYVASSLLDITNLRKREELKLKIQQLILEAKFSS